MLAELGWWGLNHRPTTDAHRIRVEVLYEGGRPMWEASQDELRWRHLDEHMPDVDGPSVSEQFHRAVAELDA